MITKTPNPPALSPLAGQAVPKEMLVDLARLQRDYYERYPDLTGPNQRVSFGTSGHRGSSLRGTFTEAHILAIAQAICDFRRLKGTNGPLYLGKDTHAPSSPAQRTALEVLAVNDVRTIIQRVDGATPTPVISHALLGYIRGRERRQDLRGKPEGSATPERDCGRSARDSEQCLGTSAQQVTVEKGQR